MKKITVIALVLVLLGTFLSCGGSGSSSQTTQDNSTARAVNFPSKELRVVSPYAAGGNTDLNARSIANILQEQKIIDQTMVVSNITGANSMNGVKAVMDAAADGYTMLIHHTAFLAVNASGAGTLRYDNMIPLIEVSVQPFLVVLSANSGFNGVDEIVAHANSRPGELTIGFVGTGSSSHLASYIFLDTLGILGKVKMVTYSSGTDALTAHLSGELVMRVGPSADSARYVASGDMKVLAKSCPDTNALFAGVPTFQDLGSDLNYACRQGYFLPKGTPSEICQALIEIITKACKTKEYAKFCEDNGMSVSFVAGDEWGKILNKDYADIEKLFASGFNKN